MLGGVAAAGALLGANDQRDSGLAAEHVAQLGRLVDDRLHGQADEVDVHDLGDRPTARRGGADGHRGDGFFGDGRVAHALGAEFFGQALGDAEDAAAAPAGDVLAHHEDGRVAPHLFAQRLVERFGVGDAARLACRLRPRLHGLSH